MYDKECKYELSKSERSLLTCATGLLYKKKHYRNYLYLSQDNKEMMNLIKLGLVQDRQMPNILDSSNPKDVYFTLTEEGIRIAYTINGYKVPKVIK